MAGLAQMLKQKGFEVSGSDKANSKILEMLKQSGIEVFLGHKAEQVVGADRVILSSAISPNNPEWLASKLINIPILHRAEALAELAKTKQKTVLILGSHGKTTTTGLIVSILNAAGLNPSYAIGATYYASGLNACLDSGDVFVVEGDESDQSFKYFQPDILILTNIDEDHLETYDHDLEKLKTAYLNFIQTLSPDALVILNQDDFHCRSLIPKIKTRLKTYGYENADLIISEIKIGPRSTSFEVDNAVFSVALPGAHNAENSAAALLVAQELKIDLESQKKGLKDYRGASRRCEVHGESDFLGLELPFLLIEDYGHHPAEITATLKALKQAYPERRLVLIFQPHRYTRTQALLDSFAKALSLPDVLILLDIYAASEKPIEGVSSELLIKKIREIKSDNSYLAGLSNCLESLEKIVCEGDLVLIQGAGDVHCLVERLMTETRVAIF